MLNQLKENDPDFPWKELGEYQNLTALLSTSVPVKPPQKDLKSEIRNIFVNILKGSEVDYPIVASELPIVEPITDSIKEPVIAPVVKPIPESMPKPIADPISEPIPIEMSQEIVMPEKKEKQETGFQMKFRDLDPKALMLLKKMETVQTDQKPAQVLSKTENGVRFKDYNEVVKKPGALVNKTLPDLTNKEVKQDIVKQNEVVQNKFSSSDIKKPEVQIKNTDPSIVIKDTKPLMVKDTVVTKNRLIPNSSINLKDFLKKEESIPGVKRNDNLNAKDGKEIENKPVPGINKSDVTTKTNEPPKEIKVVNPFIDNIRDNLQNKSAETIKSQPDVKIKTNVAPKEEERIISSTVKDEKVIQSKSVIPINEDSDIKIRTNEPPKEILTNNPFVGDEVKSPQSKSIEPVLAKPDLNIGKNEPPKEIKNENPFIRKDIKLPESTPDLTEVEKFDILIKTNRPPKEILSNNPFVAKDIKSPESNLVAPVVKKPDIEIKENKPTKEVSGRNVFVEKDVKTTESKPTVPLTNISAIKSKVTEPIKPKNEVKSEVDKKENPFQSVKTSEDKTSFKIRETSFIESDKKSTVLKPADNTPVSANTKAKTVADELIDVNKVKESINIDEVLTKLDDTKLETLLGGSYYYTKVQKIRRKSRRNILAAAALFAVLIVSGIFIFLRPQNTPVKVSSDVKTHEKPVVSEPINVVPQKDSVAVTSLAVDIDKPVENPITELKKSEPKISLPPLPETLSKEESTYFALNEKSDLLNNTIKVNNQTAAAKTENIVPPKEEKIVEEEPTFFVAVEEMPELIGGIKGLQSKITYPEIAKRVGIEGKVIVQAIVDESGNVISVNTLKGIGSGCDEVAMDAVRNSKFTPGKQRGKTVKTQITIPIVFKK
jgi:protein TonB